MQAWRPFYGGEHRRGYATTAASETQAAGADSRKGKDRATAFPLVYARNHTQRRCGSSSEIFCELAPSGIPLRIPGQFDTSRLLWKLTRGQFSVAVANESIVLV
jgi:hypothetical protein